MALRGMQVVPSSIKLFQKLILPFVSPSKTHGKEIDFVLFRFGDQGWYDICPAVSKLKKIIVIADQEEVSSYKLSKQYYSSPLSLSPSPPLSPISVDSPLQSPRSLSEYISSQESFLEQLPTEVLIKIILELDRRSLNNLTQTCKKFYYLFDKNLWVYLLREKRVEVTVLNIEEHPNNHFMSLNQNNSSPDNTSDEDNYGHPIRQTRESKIDKMFQKKVSNLQKKYVDEDGNYFSIVRTFKEGYYEYLKKKEIGPKYGSWSCFSDSQTVFKILSSLLPPNEPRWIVLRNDKKRQIHRFQELKKLRKEYLNRKNSYFLGSNQKGNFSDKCSEEHQCNKTVNSLTIDLDEYDNQIHKKIRQNRYKHYTDERYSNRFSDIVFVQYIPFNVSNNPRVAYRSGSKILQKKIESIIQNVNQVLLQTNDQRKQNNQSSNEQSISQPIAEVPTGRTRISSSFSPSSSSFSSSQFSSSPVSSSEINCLCPHCSSSSPSSLSTNCSGPS